MTATVERRISQIPGAMARIAARDINIAQVADMVGDKRVRLAGMGGSYNACVAALPLLWANGIDARADLASVLLHFADAALSPDDVYLLLSTSGTSIETVRLAEKLAARGAKVVAVTNAPQSALAAAATLVIDQQVSDDDSYAFGVFTSNYLTLYQLASVIGSRPVVPFAAAEESAAQIAAASQRLLERLPKPPFAVEYLGRGPLVGSAQQSTLIMREIARVPAGAWDGSNYRHGPIEAVRDDIVTVLLAGRDGAVADHDRSLASHLRSISGEVLVIGPDDGNVSTGGPAEYQPLLSILPTVHLAYRWALDAGLEPGEFRFTSHTITDEQ